MQGWVSKEIPVRMQQVEDFCYEEQMQSFSWKLSEYASASISFISILHKEAYPRWWTMYN